MSRKVIPLGVISRSYTNKNSKREQCDPPNTYPRHGQEPVIADVRKEYEDRYHCSCYRHHFRHFWIYFRRLHWSHPHGASLELCDFDVAH